MTEVMDTGDTAAFSDNLVLDDHKLYTSESLHPIPVKYIHDRIAPRAKKIEMAPTPRIEDLDKAYSNRRIKYARAVLDYLTRHVPYFYSPRQNRIALNQLAHPIQQQLAIEQYGGTMPSELPKEIEAIYGYGAEQLKFLLDQEASIHNPHIHANVEGGLSELTVFLLATRHLTGEVSDPYYIVPSTEAEDNGPVTPEGVHHGFDFKVIRRHDGIQIPLQVKTSPVRTVPYVDDILVVSVADLVQDRTNARTVTPTPLTLARSIYFEIEGAQNYDEKLITMAEQRLLTAFDSYTPSAR